MKSLLIIKVGDTMPEISAQCGDFEQWIIDGLGALNIPLQIIDPRHGDALPAMDQIAGVVISGSDAMVTDREVWSEALCPWLSQLVAQATPLLGICYGHQLLAHALGGEVAYHSMGMEVGTVSINQTAAAKDDPLFKNFPAEFQAQAIHSQTVLRLPPQAVILASNAFEPHHAFRIGEAAWGVQYHPEFNSDIMRRYLHLLHDELPPHGADAQTLIDAVRATELATSVLRKFAELVMARSQERTCHELTASAFPAVD